MECPFRAARQAQSLLTRGQIDEALERGELPAWAGPVFRSFEQTLLSKQSLFPCTFAVEGLRSNTMRYLFVDDPADARSLKLVKESLRHYLVTARDIHKYTSMVVFFKPDDTLRSADQYRAGFWNTLQYLHDNDPSPWPSDKPLDPVDPEWTFCFAGEPVFVVCNTPAHANRRSRHADSMTITFQPQWVFDGLKAHPHRSERVRALIRSRLEAYDAEPVSPAIGVFGDPNNREWKQYFLADVDADDPVLAPNARCPLSIGGADHANSN